LGRISSPSSNCLKLLKIPLKKGNRMGKRLWGELLLFLFRVPPWQCAGSAAGVAVLSAALAWASLRLRVWAPFMVVLVVLAFMVWMFMLEVRERTDPECWRVRGWRVHAANLLIGGSACAAGLVSTRRSCGYWFLVAFGAWWFVWGYWGLSFYFALRQSGSRRSIQCESDGGREDVGIAGGATSQRKEPGGTT
jgi:hypothetical protein